MANLYSFVSRKSLAPTVESVKNATRISTVDAYKKANHKAGEFIFTDKGEDAELIKQVMKDLVSVRIWSEKNADGIVFTKGEATDTDGIVVPFRCYGKKGEIVNEKTITGDALKSLVWGICTQDGKTIEEIRHDLGNCVSYPVAYLHIA